MKGEIALVRKLAVAGIVSLLFLAGCGGGTSPSSINQPVSSGSNATPTITTISPNCTVPGSAAFTLTINGTNFVTASMVKFGGSAPATTFVNSTQLTAAIPAASIASTGTPAVTVTNPAPGGGSSNTSTFTITAGAPQSIAVDPAGKFAYVAGDGCDVEDYVSVYTINPTTGALVSTGPPVPLNDEFTDSVTVDPSGKFAYVASSGDVWDIDFGSVLTYTINPTTGALTSTTGGISGTGTNGTPEFFNSVAVDPSGKFAYAADGGAFPPGSFGGDSSVSMYTINSTTGALTSIGMIAAGTGPVSVAVDPAGKFAYVANFESNDLSMYTIDATTGALASTGTIAAGPGPVSVAVDPAGKFAYVADWTYNTEGSVSMYTIDATTGALTFIGSIAAGTSAFSVAVDPAGKFAYVANWTGNDTEGSVSTYTIDATTGVLTPSGTIATELSPTSIVIHPSGKFAYVTNSGSNSVSMYSIDNATGTLTLIGTVGT